MRLLSILHFSPITPESCGILRADRSCCSNSKRTSQKLVEVTSLLNSGFYSKRNVFTSFYKAKKAVDLMGSRISLLQLPGSQHIDVPPMRESNAECNEEFKQLNALKKKFKQAFKLDDSFDAPTLKQKISTYIQEEVQTLDGEGYADDDPESEPEDLYNEVGVEYKIKFKVDKKLTDKNFIFDLHSKRDHLCEMLDLLQVILECSTVGTV